MKTLILIIVIIFAFLMVVYLTGYMNGMEKMRQIHEQVKCQSAYGDIPFKDIPGDCIKWFKAN